MRPFHQRKRSTRPCDLCSYEKTQKWRTDQICDENAENEKPAFLGKSPKTTELCHFEHDFD